MTEMIVEYFALGMACWLTTWGTNRAWLAFKRLLS